MALYRPSALASFLTSFLSFGKSDLDCLILYMNKRYFIYIYAYLFVCLYICIHVFFFLTYWNSLFSSFRNKMCRGEGQKKDVTVPNQTSSNAFSTDPVLYKIGEDNEGYQELRVTWVCDFSDAQFQMCFSNFQLFWINNECIFSV